MSARLATGDETAKPTTLGRTGITSENRFHTSPIKAY